MSSIKGHTQHPDPFTYQCDVFANIATPSPRKVLQSKISTFFTHSGNNTPRQATPDPFLIPDWTSDSTEAVTRQQAKQMVKNIMCKLLTQSSTQLDTRYNNMLMSIFEAFRVLDEEVDVLRQAVEEAARSKQAQNLEFRKAKYTWKEEQRRLESEIKRLDLITTRAANHKNDIGNGNDDRIKVTELKTGNARKETIFEFLDKSYLFEHHDLSNQRAIMRSRPYPQDQTKTLISMTSMTSIHADLPFGTPTSLDSTSSSSRKASMTWQTQSGVVETTSLPEPQFSTIVSSSYGNRRRVSKIPSPVFPSKAKPRRQNERSVSSSS